ncbi:Palmitoyltransferase zdhhc14 [Actinomortierella ambigua]|nr:Palmitoyltransferase zdhhc14 [Actinomortierella ambigua]
MNASPSIDGPPSVERAATAAPPDMAEHPISASTPISSDATATTTEANTTLLPTTTAAAATIDRNASIGQEQLADTAGPSISASLSPTYMGNRPSQLQEPISLLEQLKGTSSSNQRQQQDPSYLTFESFFSVPSSPEERGMSFEEMLMANEAVAAAASAATAGDTYRSPTQDILLRPTSPYRRPFGVHSISQSSPSTPSFAAISTSARSTPQTPITSPAAGPTPSSTAATDAITAGGTQGVAAAAASPSTTTITSTTNTPSVSPGVLPIAIPTPNHSRRVSHDHDRDDLPPHSPSSDPSSVKTILSSAGYFPGTSPEEMEEAALDYRLKGRSRASRGYSADFSTNNWTSAMGIGSGYGPNQPGSPRSKSPASTHRQGILHGHGHSHGHSHGGAYPHPPSPGVASSSSQHDLSDHHALSSHSSSTHHLAQAIRPGGSGGGGDGGARRGRQGPGTSTTGSSTEELPLTEFLSKTAPPPPPVPPKSSVYQLPEYPPASFQGGFKASPTDAGRASVDSPRGSSSFQGPRTLYAGFPNFRPPTSPPPTDGFTINFANQTPKIPITSVSGDFTGFQDYDPEMEEILESRNRSRKNPRSSPKEAKFARTKGNNNGAVSSETSATTMATGASPAAAGGNTVAAATAATETEETHENSLWVRRYKVFPGQNVFLLHGRIMTSRDFPAFIVAVLLILVPTGLFHGYVSPYLWYHLSPAAPLVQAYLFIVAFSTMLKTSWTDPGVIPRGLDSDPPLDPPLVLDDAMTSFYPPKALPRVKEIQVGMYTVRLKYCDTCRIYRPPRCSHCRQCNNCVAAVYALLTAGLCLTHLLMLYNEKKDEPGRSFARDAMGRAPVSSIVMLFAFIMGCAVGALAGYHYWLATVNRTTHEQLGASMMRPDEVDNPFDRGSIAKNCAAVLCRPPTKSYVRRRDYTLA